jgi:hypothetical protein
MKTKPQLRLALLKIAEGLKNELPHMEFFDIPDGVMERLKALEKIAWDALENPSVADCQRIQEQAKI